MYQDEGEWNDFEEENKDYSGLKIQALSMKYVVNKIIFWYIFVLIAIYY